MSELKIEVGQKYHDDDHTYVVTKYAPKMYLMEDAPQQWLNAVEYIYDPSEVEGWEEHGESNMIFVVPENDFLEHFKNGEKPND